MSPADSGAGAHLDSRKSPRRSFPTSDGARKEPSGAPSAPHSGCRSTLADRRVVRPRRRAWRLGAGSLIGLIKGCDAAEAAEWIAAWLRSHPGTGSIAGTEGDDDAAEIEAAELTKLDSRPPGPGGRHSGRGVPAQPRHRREIPNLVIKFLPDARARRRRHRRLVDCARPGGRGANRLSRPRRAEEPDLAAAAPLYAGEGAGRGLRDAGNRRGRRPDR